MHTEIAVEDLQAPEILQASLESDCIPSTSLAGLPATSAAMRRVSSPASRSSLTHELLAQGVEFVARPGKTRKLQKAISLAMSDAHKTCVGFAGAVVLVSEQEERLVTVITFWAGNDEIQRDENCERVKQLLEPYVDHWLRSRKFVSFLSCLGGSSASTEQALIPVRVV